MHVAYVKIWGEIAGAVVWNESKEYASFEYSSSFRKTGWELAPLTMPMSTNKQLWEFPELKKDPESPYDTFKGLPGLLADVLPDKYGNALINEWLAKNGRPANSMNPVELLCFIGSRGMGALEFEPVVVAETSKSTQLEINSLVDIAHKILNQKKQFSANLTEDEAKALADILKVGTSAGGARPKAVIAYNEKTGEVRTGQSVDLPIGFTHWLLKLDGVSDIQLGETHGYGRVEMAYYLMAQDCGIDMMPSKLIEENGRAHFMTQRFDRTPDGQKHHVQTFCAMKHFDFNLANHFSYEQLFQTMRELRLPYTAAEQMFRRMVFNVLARNCDDHTKNFAFMLPKNGEWQLAPAYDLCHAYRPDSLWVNRHALSVNGKRENIGFDDFMEVAKNMNIKKAKDIVKQINDIVSNWRHYAQQVEVNPRLIEAIESTFVRL
jgi:serine/threonine-protein kinase HipA